GPRLRPMHRQGKLAGPAFTVKTAAGDNLLVHKALDAARAGDVIVVDAGGFLDNAIIGELMMTRAKQRGVAGIVIWGAIRDSAEIGRSEEHTSELQSRENLVCRLLLEKKKLTA